MHRCTATNHIINRLFAVLASSGAISLVAAFTLQGAVAMPLGQSQALRAATAQTSFVVPAGCYKWEFYGDLGSCQRKCSQWLPSDLQGYSYIWNTTNCSDTHFPPTRRPAGGIRATP